MESYRLNPDDEDIREQEKRLFALDIAARTYPGLGRHDGIVKYAGELLAFVNGPVVSVSIQSSPPTLADLMSLIPKRFLRTKKELKAANVEPPEVPQEPHPSERQDDDGPLDGNGGGHDVGRVQDGGDKVNPSLRQQAGGQSGA